MIHLPRTTGDVRIDLSTITEDLLKILELTRRQNDVIGVVHQADVLVGAEILLDALQAGRLDEVIESDIWTPPSTAFARRFGLRVVVARAGRPTGLLAISMAWKAI
jgi:hypothetical protein